MHSWISIVISLCAVAANLFVQFYSRFVPDIEDQKRHLKWLWWWTVDILAIAGQIYAVCTLAQSKGPVTRLFVTGVAFSMSCLTFSFVLLGFRRFILAGIMQKALDNFGSLVEHSAHHLDQTGVLVRATEKLIETSDLHSDALRAIAADHNLSPETVQTLQGLLSNKKPPAMASQPVIGTKSEV